MPSPTKARQIQQAIADDIVHGRLAPGAALDETSIAAAFGVSRTPIREAIRQLEAIGLVEARVRRGAVVATLSDRQLDEMFAVMAELEALCARWSAIAMTAAERRQLLALQEESARLVSAGQREAYVDFNYRFHEAIYRGTHNDFLADAGAQRAHALRPLPPGAVRDPRPARQVACRARRGGDRDPARRRRYGGDRDARAYHRGAHGRRCGRRPSRAAARRAGGQGRGRRGGGGRGASRGPCAADWGNVANRLIVQQSSPLAYNTASNAAPEPHRRRHRAALAAAVAHPWQRLTLRGAFTESQTGARPGKQRQRSLARRLPRDHPAERANRRPLHLLVSL